MVLSVGWEDVETPSTDEYQHQNAADEVVRAAHTHTHPKSYITGGNINIHREAVKIWILQNHSSV